jgi:hypothetical protein
MPIRKLKKNLDKQYRGWVILTLIVLTIIGLSLRFILSTGEGVPESDKVYILTYDASFSAAEARSVIRLSPPWDTANAVVIAQSIQNEGLRLVRGRAEKESKREIVALTTTPGKSRLIAEFTLHISPIGHPRLPQQALPLTAQQRERFLGSSNGIDIDSPEVAEVIARLAAQQQEQQNLIALIFEYANKKILPDRNPSASDASTVLRTHKADTLGRASAMVALLRAARIPARLVTGFVLKDGFDVGVHYWLESNDQGKWIPYDPENGYSGSLPPDYVPVRRGGDSIVGESSVTNISISYDISEQYVPIGKLGREARSLTDILDLTRLSLDARSTLAILLLLPLGALFTVFCTSIIGIRTYGTFTATLLALAAVYADWITTTIILAIVAIAGLLGRYVMPDKLTRVPRLTIVFTLAAMSMTLAVSLMDFYSFNPAGHVVLLPIIILTSMIDLLYKALDESGVRIAMIRLGWTAAVATGCYLILIQERIGHFILTYPELHLFTVALVLSFSAYKYTKLSDLSFFNWLAEPQKRQPSRSTEKIEKKPSQVSDNIR